MTACDDDLQAIRREAPELPPGLHNEFEGYAVIRFLVRGDGKVHGPSIESSEWSPVGLTRGAPEGYDEAVLAAISKWQYPRRKDPCRARTTIRIVFQE